VIVLEERIYVYNFADLKLVDHIETIKNPKALAALCSHASSNVLACPAIQKGHVRVSLYDTNKHHTIMAHNGPLAALSLNQTGTLLATASEKGTLIRIFDTVSGTSLQELRRGTSEAIIYSICFNSASDLIAVSSNKGTVHVFQIKSAEEGEDKK